MGKADSSSVISTKKYPHLQERYSPKAVAERPALRGISHLIMVPVAVSLAVWLSVRAEPLTRPSVIIFGVALIGLYSVSSIYHVSKWTGKVRMWWNRFDTAMITLFIVATMTPVSFVILTGISRWIVLGAAWFIALSYVALTLSPVVLPSWVKASAYVLMGWLSAGPIIFGASKIPLNSIILLSAGGLLYTFGALVYARKKPDPIPKWFGYHEIFHLFVVLASLCHVCAVAIITA